MNAKPERPRLGELLLDMRLVDEASLDRALETQRTTGRHLSTLLAEQRVLDEERLTKAVAARLGLEAVSISSHRVHDRVLALVPYALAKKYGLLPIAIKRTQAAEVVYLVMVDPLNTEALAEVQRGTGRQVRVLMASASELDATIERHYQGLEQRLAQAGSSRPPARGASTTSGTPPRAAPPRRPSAVHRPPAAPDAPPPIVRGTPAEPARAGPPGRPAAAPLPRAPSGLGSRPPELRPAAEPPRAARGSEPGRVTPRPSPRVSQVPPDALRPSPAPARPAASPRPSISPPPLSRDALRPAGPPGTEPSAEISAVPRPDGSGGRFAPLEAPPLPKGPKVTGLGLPAVARPAPFPGPGRFDPNNPATLIDTARPPEIEQLSRGLSGSNDPVVPSDLDPPDAIATRIDAPLGYTPPPAAPPPPPAKPAMDWDLGVGDWDAGDDPAWPQNASAEDMASTAGPPQASPHDEPVTNFDGEWSPPTSGEDDSGPEDIATSQFELSDVSAEDLRTPPPPEPAPDRRKLAATLEVPVDLEDGFNPFEGPSPNDVPVGLERTGIFPAVDFEAGDFEPPPLSGATRAWAGADIPDSAAAVEARFGEAHEEDDGIEAIEEVALEPLDEGGRARVEEPLPAGEDSDAEAMPVIEPSSLVSLMDESPESADTGADEIPDAARGGPQPPTRVFDESNRQVLAPPRADGGESIEEPTNPRMSGIDPADFEPSDAPPATRSAANTVEEPVPDEAELFEATAAEGAAAPTAEPEPEEPTPAQDSVAREDVLSALEGAFVPRSASATAPPPASGPAASAASRALVDALLAGSSLASAERAQLVLALGRLLIEKGILEADALVEALDRSGPADARAADASEDP